MGKILRFLLLTIFFLNGDAAEENSFSGLVDISSERKIYLECQGNGSPTVVLVSGRSDRASIWKPVISEVSKFTHVCAYDRPGTVTITDQDSVIASRSTSVPQPTTPKDAVADLHTLLMATKIPGPYVLVGHSYAGLIVRLYASTYPDEVVGLVLVDTLTEQLFDALTPKEQDLWIRLNSNYSKELDRYTIQERLDLVASFNQLRSASPLHPMPAVVLTTDQPFDFRSLIAQGILPKDAPLDFGPILSQVHLKTQERLAQSLNARHITKTHAGHYIHTEQPKLVIDAIREVVEKIKTSPSK
ncbi:MAG: alpha/beta hydrolase [Parachlamydia sp.]|nr:alpha/beta hydrolase [Parachlamydia sp.]